jgi:hypothetical protein
VFVGATAVQYMVVLHATVRLCDAGGKGRLIKEMNGKKREGGEQRVRTKTEGNCKRER